MGIKVRDGGEPAALEHGGLDYATEDGSHTWAKQRHELYLEKRMEHVHTVQSAAADQFTCAPSQQRPARMRNRLMLSLARSLSALLSRAVRRLSPRLSARPAALR